MQWIGLEAALTFNMWRCETLKNYISIVRLYSHCATRTLKTLNVDRPRPTAGDLTKTLFRLQFHWTYRPIVALNRVFVSWVNSEVWIHSQDAAKVNFTVFFMQISFSVFVMQATFKGWMDIMKHAIDGNQVNLKLCLRYRILTVNI